MARRVNLSNAKWANQDKCNKLVLNGIKRKCNNLKLKLSNKNAKKLCKNKGKFPLYVHPESKRLERRNSSKKNAAKERNKMTRLYNLNQGQVLAKSP